MWVIFVPLVSVIAAVLVTRKKAAFVVSRWVASYVPAEADTARGAYRDAAMVRQLEQVPASHATGTLPPRVLEAATFCRLAFILASLFAAPVVALGILDGLASATLTLGWTGLALAGGQLVARRCLLTASPSSPAVAAGVGVWTLLHNLVVLGCVVVCSQIGRNLHGDWAALPIGVAGVGFVLYAVCSMALGLLLCSAGAAQRRWLAENGAVPPAGDAAEERLDHLERSA